MAALDFKGLAIIGAICYVIYRIILSIQSMIRFNRFAQDRGCKEALSLSGAWPWSLLDGWARLPGAITALMGEDDFLDWFVVRDLSPADTTSRTNFFSEKMILTSEPANMQAMLATQFKEYEVGPLRVAQFYPLLGQSIFTSDGSFWEHSRALFRPQFNREQINDLDSTSHAIEVLIEAIGPVDANGWSSSAEFLPLLFNFTLDTATEFLFGESVESQRQALTSKKQSSGTDKVQRDGGNDFAKQFSDDFALANHYMLMRIHYGPFYPLADSYSFRSAISRIRTFTEHFVQKAISASEVEAKSEDNRFNLLSALATQTQDRTELRNQTLAILTAGRDTTASLLGWCFQRLALHPHIFNKLRDIVVHDFHPDKAVTFEKLKACRYLRHFLNEVLRLHPTVPLNLRFAAQDTTLPVGGGADQQSPVAVHKGDKILYSVYVMHRRKDLWGEDAAEFRPERWESRIPAWQFLPFSGGPRICLGQQFALTEASLLLVRLLQQFDAIEPVDRAEMMRMKKGLGLTMWPKDNVKVRFHRAQPV